MTFGLANPFLPSFFPRTIVVHTPPHVTHPTLPRPHISLKKSIHTPTPLCIPLIFLSFLVQSGDLVGQLFLVGEKMYRLSRIPALLAEEMQMMYMMRNPNNVFDASVPSGVWCMDRVPRLNPKVWEPFPTDAPERKRRIRVFEMPPLGRGTFGILFAVAVEVPAENVHDWKVENGDDGGDDILDPFVVLAAMKMTPILKDHSEELINGLAINDLVRSGCTPSVMRLIDGFCVTTLSSTATCEMPPAEWKESLWRYFDRFVYTRQEDLIRLYGSTIMRPIPDTEENKGRARLSGGATVGFLFTELSTRFLLELNTVRSGDSVISPEDDLIDSANQGLHSGSDLITKTYLMIQSVDALNAGTGLLHMDLHGGNFIDVPSFLFRTNLCFFETRRGSNMRTNYFGLLGVERPNDERLHLTSSGTPLVFRVSDLEDVRTVAVINKTRNLPALIDYGKTVRPRFEEGMLSHDKLGEHLFGNEAFLDERLPAEMPLPLTLSHSKPAYASRNTTPATRIVSAPTTNLYTRPFEQLNPFIMPKLQSTSDFHADSYYVSFYTEASEVYSVAACVAQLILGYNPFGRVIRTTLPLPNGQIPATNRSTGPRVVLPKNAEPAFGPRCYALRHSYLDTVVKECAPERSHGEMGTRQKQTGDSSAPNHLRKSSYTSNGKEPTIIHCTPDSDTYELRSYIIRNTAHHEERQTKPCHFYSYVPKGVGDKTSNDSVGGETMSDIATAIIARINAVGLPKKLDGLRGTFLYPYLQGVAANHAKNREVDRDTQRSGWLFPALFDALRDRWGIDIPLAKDFTHRLIDALSIDPADRPTLQRLMQSDIFKWNLFTDTPRVPVANVQLLWSSIRPSITNAPPYFMRERNLKNLNRNFTPRHNLFVMPPEEARDKCNLLDWARSAYLNVARLQCFIRDQTSIPGFLLRRSDRMPRLLSDEGGLAAFYNYKMGVLDYYTGSPCAVAGKEKFLTLIKEERLGGMVHFANEKTRQHFWNLLTRIHMAEAEKVNEGGPESSVVVARIPAWIFANLYNNASDSDDNSVESDEASSDSSSTTLGSSNPMAGLVEGGEVNSAEEIVEQGSLLLLVPNATNNTISTDTSFSGQTFCMHEAPLSYIGVDKYGHAIIPDPLLQDRLVRQCSGTHLTQDEQGNRVSKKRLRDENPDDTPDDDQQTEKQPPSKKARLDPDLKSSA